MLTGGMPNHGIPLRAGHQRLKVTTLFNLISKKSVYAFKTKEYIARFFD
jgi:hypothetical protein